MKKTLTLILLSFFSTLIYSQKIIKNPKTGYSTAPYLSIKKIEITNTATVLSFEISQNAGFRFSIPKETYIKDAASNEKLLIKSAEGIPINDMNVIPESGVMNYKLVFGKLDKSVTKIEYGEANDGGSWRIYDIALQDLPNPSGINTELEGNWYNTENANWEIGFYDTNAIYKSQVWKYDAVALKKGNGSITLTNKDEKYTLFVKKGEAGNYFIGEDPKSLIAFTNTIKNLAVKSTDDDKPYELPIFKNEAAVYSGYIKNYSKQTDIKTIAIHIDDIITGEQNTKIAKIDENGFFTIKIPLYYPHEVWVRSPVFNGSVFLEPGKTLFQMLGDKNSLFMGESAKINSDLIKFNPRWFNYEEMSSKILDMKPLDYKAYCQNLANNEMDKLETLKKANAIGNKAYQVKKIDIQYDNFEKLMSYNSNFETAYRKKYKIPNEQREITLKMDTLTADYYNFITDELANNQLAVISNNYRYYINRLQYLDLINLKSVSTGISDITKELQKRGYSFTDQEQKLLNYTNELEAFQNTPEQKEFQEKYGKISLAFFTKHQKIINELAKDKSFSLTILEAYLIKNNIPVSAEEKEFLKAEKKLAKFPFAQKLKQYPSISNDSNEFYKKHQAIPKYLYSEKRTDFRNEKLAQLFNVKTGFATDIMASQDICNTVVAQLTPLPKEDLVIAQKQIKTPFIADYVAKCNEQTIAKIESNKKQTDYILNETPKTEGDELFASIMKKYKGKVVYVDFWATWCGPCRSGIEQIKPLKEEMAGENVAFVYLTNQTSPENTYSAMIPEIKGEHYRLSADQWNYLAGKFNISGIPHYVLAGKNGEVINPKLGHLSNEQLKAELEKWIKK